MQLVSENMKLREISMHVKGLEAASSAKQLPLEQRFERSLKEIDSQKQKFMHQLQMVNCEEN